MERSNCRTSTGTSPNWCFTNRTTMEPRPPLNFGMIGLNFGGDIADTLSLAPANGYFQLAAVCDADADRALEFGRSRDVKTYVDLDEMLADADIQAVGLFTGPIGRA